MARINRQLSDFYGPLFALTETNNRIFSAFAERNARPDGRSPFDHDIPPTEEELAEWRLWITTVFLPNIQAMRDIIVTKADLLAEPHMPAVLLRLCAHVFGYEITAARWEQGDHNQHLSVLPYPSKEISTYARQGCTRLKKEQSALLGRRQDPEPA
ncbi:MAG TPA: hypothetical protein VGI84_05725 [Pseudonocardiaceae bacterium]|jgi:hypothetical protein